MRPQTEELLRDIEERWIPELRKELEPLGSGMIRTLEIDQDGRQIDTTQARIISLNRWITTYQAMAAKLRDEKADI